MKFTGKILEERRMNGQQAFEYLSRMTEEQRNKVVICVNDNFVDMEMHGHIWAEADKPYKRLRSMAKIQEEIQKTFDDILKECDRIDSKLSGIR